MQYEASIDSFVIPSKENDKEFKSNLENFYLLKNMSSCLHGSRRTEKQKYRNNPQ